MINVFKNWYARLFADPHATMLLILGLIITLTLTFFSSVLMPVLIALVLAYLLEWPVNKLERRGLGRSVSVAVVVLLFIFLCVFAIVSLVPVITQQASSLIGELPVIWGAAYVFVQELPNRYPTIIDYDVLADVLSAINERVASFGEQVLSFSVASLGSFVALVVYVILVPLMMFFMLKDKAFFIASIDSILPQQRRLIDQVGAEMNLQLANYIRGKAIELLIVGSVSIITFLFLDLRYAVLLGVLVGLSVMVPYIGATLVTFPVVMVALFQFNFSSEFWYVVLAYAIIQILDGNVLVPLLFSEAVDLHPLYIIIAVLVFGGLFGFWGVFFAIPLASLLKAVLTALNSGTDNQQVAAT